MQNVIKQAFAHAEEIGPQIEEGHYDLVGPDGDTILPHLWSTTVQPGWRVSIHVWPELGTPGRHIKATTEDTSANVVDEVSESIPEATSEVGSISEEILQDICTSATDESNEEIRNAEPTETLEPRHSKVSDENLEVVPGEAPTEEIIGLIAKGASEKMPEEAPNASEGISQVAINEALETVCGQTPEGRKSGESSKTAPQEVVEAASKDSPEGRSSEETSESVSGGISQQNFQSLSQRTSEEIAKSTPSSSPSISVLEIFESNLKGQDFTKHESRPLKIYS